MMLCILEEYAKVAKVQFDRQSPICQKNWEYLSI